MLEQCPKTSKVGGLPNCKHEPRKLVLLVTMLKNAVECNAGMTVYIEVVHNIEQQSRKKHSKEKTHFPDGSNILVHVVEALRQFEGS